MDAGNRSAGSSSLSCGRHRRLNSRDENLDRFIPNRAAMDFDYASYMLNSGRNVEKETASAFGADYQKVLVEALGMKRNHLLSFKNKPSPPRSVNSLEETYPFSPKFKCSKPMRYISRDSERTLDAPRLVEEDYLNVLDWGASNTLAIGLENDVHLLAESDGTVSELLSTDDVSGPVTSVRWAPDGRHIAVGFNNSEVQLWDASTYRLVRTLREGHGGDVGSLDWNGNILTTGSMEGLIINHDLRQRSHVIRTYKGHHQEVCGLKWSTCGQRLASGGNDNLVCIWSLHTNRRLHQFSDYTGGVKALAWCPFESNLLASGGVGGDDCIKFWNSNTGVCLKSVNTGSAVSALLWNRHEQELLSSHGSDSNQLTLWKHPSMVKLIELCEHTSPVLNMTQSPDGYKVASLGCDERLRIWNVFGTLQPTKHARNTKPEPFAYFPSIR